MAKEQAVPEQGSDKIQGDKFDHVLDSGSKSNSTASAPDPSASTPSNAGSGKAPRA